MEELAVLRLIPRRLDSDSVYSLIKTAKVRGLNPVEYHLHVFKRLPHACSEGDLKALLPQDMSKNDSV